LGCGNPVNYLELEKGEKVLDLGSGLGIDVFLASDKVGPGGRAVGIDASEEMVQNATKIAKRNGYENVEFKRGEIEEIPFERETFDAVTSNCVVNLSTDKLRTYEEIYRVLKPDGRILISDIVIDGELPDENRKNPEAWASCIGGAVKKAEYLDIIEKAGFENIDVISQSTFESYEELETEILSMQVKASK
ncbi:arsenite S-adenosylmethyltransferase, partial [candidate division MSBL1 archaeon SCGC-AAA382M17]